jgi:hypothetical protein
MRSVMMEVARRESEAPRGPGHQLLRVTGVLLLVAVVAIFAGTILESRWTGSMESCTRSIDDSTIQDGQASMRWIPPVIHCRFESTVGNAESARALASAEEDHFAWFGVTIALMVSFAPLLVFASIRLLRSRGELLPT